MSEVSLDCIQMLDDSSFRLKIFDPDLEHGAHQFVDWLRGPTSQKDTRRTATQPTHTRCRLCRFNGVEEGLCGRGETV
jgi:hypothetical protein